VIDLGCESMMIAWIGSCWRPKPSSLLNSLKRCRKSIRQGSDAHKALDAIIAQLNVRLATPLDGTPSQKGTE
jgi:hypothetical protein